MKKKISKHIQSQLKAMGDGARKEYIDCNPHGYKSVHKVHKSKKAYNRKGRKGEGSCDLYSFYLTTNN